MKRLHAFPNDLNDLEASSNAANFGTASSLLQGVDGDLRVLDNIFDGADLAMISAWLLQSSKNASSAKRTRRVEVSSTARLDIGLMAGLLHHRRLSHVACSFSEGRKIKKSSASQ